MKRPANTLAAALAFWLLSTPFSFSQNHLDRQPCPDVDEKALGCELIAWSKLQAPAPLPDAPSAQNQPIEQANDLGAQPSHTVTGVIIKDQGRLFLRANAEFALLLDDQQNARRHEGERVTIKGEVDRERKTLHVEGITPIP